MKITIIYRYFHPDTPPYASMLKEISKWLHEAGHEVTVITSQPSYKSGVNVEKQPSTETLDGVSVCRVSLFAEKNRFFVKALNHCLFVLIAFAKVLFGKKQDVVMTASMPPIMQGLLVSLAAKLRGAHFVYHIQDIYPEIARLSGGLKGETLYGFLKWVDTKMLRGADRIVSLSSDMLATIKNRGVSEKKLRLIQNFSLFDPTVINAAAERLSTKSSKPVRFLFAGNLGRFQNLDRLVKIFGSFDASDCELILMGAGSLKTRLEEIVRQDNISNVSFHDHADIEETRVAMTECDYGVVTIIEEIYQYAFPSKTWTYLEAGLPVLAMVEDHSQLSQIIKKNKLGLVMPWLLSDADIKLALSELIRKHKQEGFPSVTSPEEYSRSQARNNWCSLMSELQSERRADR